MNFLFTSHRISWFIFFIIFAVFVDNIADLSVNVPFSDDFHQQLQTVINLENGNDVLPLLFRQHNEHRILTSHIFTYLEHSFFGSINLDNQLWISFILLLALALTLVSFCKSKNRPIALILVAVLLFSPSSSSTWVGGTTPYYALLLFSLLSIKYLTDIHKPFSLVVSVISMFLAVFSMIAGILVPLIGFIYLFFTKKILSIEGMFWILFALLSLFLYFNSYKSVSNHPDIFYFLKDPKFTFDYSFRVLGAFFSGIFILDLLTDLITLTVIFFIIHFFRNTSFKDKLSSTDFIAFIFVLLTIGTIIVGRVGFENVGAAYSSRYFIITKTLWALGFILLINNKHISREVIIFSLGIFSTLLFSQYKQEMVHLYNHQFNQSTAMIDFIVRDNNSSFTFAQDNEPAARITTQAINLGVYSPGLLPTKVRRINNLQYSDYFAGLGVSVIRNIKINQYVYYAFIVHNKKENHEVALVPRGHKNKSVLLKPATKIPLNRLNDSDLTLSNNNIYEVVIDTAILNEELIYDILIISFGSAAIAGTINSSPI